jgi:hypothetical protein
MGFFTPESVHELSISTMEAITASRELQLVMKRLQQLHEKLYAQIRLQNLDLHIITPEMAAVVPASVSMTGDGCALCVGYMRQRGQAVTVERLMGREEVASVHSIDTRRHPVIELRLGSEGLAIELILSPDAWWDQQNLVGKLRVGRHRQEFYTLLKDLSSAYRMGFWQGTHLSDMHLTAHQFQHPRIMDEWMSTFQPSADWWRLGVWYPYDAEAVDEQHIIATLIKEVKLLYALYGNLVWTSDNNFREFFKHAP